VPPLERKCLLVAHTCRLTFPDLPPPPYPPLHPFITAVVFRLLVFRPLPKELLRGTVKSVDAHAGVCISLQFYEDVWVPLNLLREGMQWKAMPSSGSGSGGYWYWLHEAEGEEAQELSLKPGNSVLFRVAAVVFGEPSERSALGSKPNPRSLRPGAALPAPENQAQPPLAPQAALAGKVHPAAQVDATQATAVVRFPGVREPILAGGEAGDGVHVPIARAIAAAGGVSAQLPPPALERLPSLRALLGQSAASRGVSSLDAVLGGTAVSIAQQAHAGNPPSLGKVFPSASSLASVARKQLGVLVGSGLGGLDGAGGLDRSSTGNGAGMGGIAGPASAVSREALGLGTARSKVAAPLTVYASIAEDGLGNLDWWEPPLEEVMEPPEKKAR
jgi:hypothetical protein